MQTPILPGKEANSQTLVLSVPAGEVVTEVGRGAPSKAVAPAFRSKVHRSQAKDAQNLQKRPEGGQGGQPPGLLKGQGRACLVGMRRVQPGLHLILGFNSLGIQCAPVTILNFFL